MTRLKPLVDYWVFQIQSSEITMRTIGVLFKSSVLGKPLASGVSPGLRLPIYTFCYFTAVVTTGIL